MGELEDWIKELEGTPRTPLQEARSKGYTEGYLACEAEQRRKAGLLEKYAETPITIIWNKMRDGQPLDAEEAIRIWREVQLTVDEHHTDGSMLLVLYDKLNRELASGERCAVCARYKNYGCRTEC